MGDLGQFSRYLTLERRALRHQEILEEKAREIALILDKEKKIIFKGQEFKITEEQRKHTACEDVWIYTTEEGLKFEFWTEQTEIIPPWTLHWYQLRDKTRIKVDNDFLNKLLTELEKNSPRKSKWYKANWISRELEKIGVTWDPTRILNRLKTAEGGREQKEIETRHLRGLIRLSNKKYEEVNMKILKAGSIENPKFPINLMNPAGARLLGAIYGDGSIVASKRGNRTYLLFRYNNKDEELLNSIIKDIKKVFGNAHYSTLTDKETGVKRLFFTSDIIGTTLAKIGAPVGDKVITNPDPPKILDLMNSREKANFLKQYFSDDGSPILSRIKLYKAIDITDQISSEDIRTLAEKALPIKGVKKEFYRIPKGELRILIREGKLSNNFLRIIDENPPKILIKIKDILEEDFGIHSKVRFQDIRLSNNRKRIKIIWTIDIYNTEDVVKYYKKINFISSEKKERLRRCIK